MPYPRIPTPQQLADLVAAATAPPPAQAAPVVQAPPPAEPSVPSGGAETVVA